MLDVKYIRDNIEVVKQAALNKRTDFDVDKLIAVDDKRLRVLQELEAKRAEQNTKSKSGPKDPAELEQLKKLKEEIRALDEQQHDVQKEFDGLMAKVPNIPSSDTPIGKDEHDNVEIYRSPALKKLSFKPQDHVKLAESLDIIDFDRGVKVAGFRGYYLKNGGAILANALMSFALEKMVKKGYKPMIPPTLVNGFALWGSGYFKGRDYDPDVDEIYRIEYSDKSDNYKYLVGTAEPSLLAYYKDEVLKEEDLPIRVAGLSQCYRSEIGSYGKDTKGIYRVHEFQKVEQVVISAADLAASDKLQQEMLSISKEIHEDLGLPYRVLQISTGDMGLGKYKMFDLEAWLPGSERWAETGSASNFTDWQARRLNIKYITKTGEKKFVYLLNNTALPTPRPIIAILENYQTKDGTVKIPKALQKYTFGLKEIKK